VAQAAVEVLEHAGFQVTIPRRSLCCGRPLYDFGMLDTAKSLLEQMLTQLSPQIQSGMPLIALEPSCLSVFRDEMVNLMPNNWDAKRLHGQCFTLSEFLEREGKTDLIPRLTRKALVHGHCHHKAVMKMDAEQSVYRKVGLDFELLNSGCCGMAGSFGFEQEHYDVSIACGERVLIPEVRKAEEGTLIIADGFSCREQVTQTTQRQVQHTAEVLALAIRGEAIPRRQTAVRQGSKWKAAAAGVVAGIAAGWWIASAMLQRAWPQMDADKRR
jgi:Fe-S oxidoreductase